jgi:hypothetical protein
VRTKEDQPEQRRSLLEGLGRGFAVYFSLFVCIVVGGGGAVVILFLWAPAWYRPDATAIATLIYLAAAPGEYFSLYFLGAKLDRVMDAELVELALEQPVLPLSSRPFVAVWWGAHFMLSILLAHWLAEYYQEAGGSHPGAWVYVLSIFARFAGAFAANFFMLLALAALWRNGHFLRQVWRLRLLVDLACVFLPLPALPVVMGPR